MVFNWINLFWKLLQSIDRLTILMFLTKFTVSLALQSSITVQQMQFSNLKIQFVICEHYQTKGLNRLLLLVYFLQF